jgi:hydrogenase expression/formation protein HypE
MAERTVKLAHGSGGVLTRQLLHEQVLRHFTSPLLAPLADSATLVVHGGPIAFTTDSYVVDPIFFPGGDIGKLAVFGTVNDLAVSGAIPKFISCSLILEEGLPEADLAAILASMRDAADAAQVEVVTGDTKVVQRGKADKVFINTAGIGIMPRKGPTPDAEAQAGDAVVVSGPLGDHGAAILVCREGLNLESSLKSDCAPVTAAAQAVLKNAERVSFLRDVTRGGLATILNEGVADSALGVALKEEAIPIRAEVRSICELLGLDPLYLACEGRVAAIVDAESADNVVRALREATGEPQCCVIGSVSAQYKGRVIGETPFGTHRLIQMLSGEQLPRIC